MIYPYLTTIRVRSHYCEPWPSSLILYTISRQYCCDSLILVIHFIGSFLCIRRIFVKPPAAIIHYSVPRTLCPIHKFAILLFDRLCVLCANFLLLYCHSRLPFGCASHHLLSTLRLFKNNLLGCLSVCVTLSPDTPLSVVRDRTTTSSSPHVCCCICCCEESGRGTI